MKLLFDQNLSHKLVQDLASLYPDSEHLVRLGLASADDDIVWAYARNNGLIIVSKDSDFYHRSMLLGHPPKVVWLKLGNCTTARVSTVLREAHANILSFERDEQAAFLVLP